MLSYQHHYHAGNLADVHKHMLLAWMLDYLTQKPKGLSYLETHAGRGLYDLGSEAAEKTGEAAGGIARLRGWLRRDHPYTRVLDQVAAQYGPMAYPGSPMIAALLLRHLDTLTLAELHPGEYTALEAALTPLGAKLRREDGFAMAKALCPPEPRRGMVLIDPSYEVKDDYDAIPGHIGAITKRWTVGIVALWYPVLTGGAHRPMLGALTRAYPEALRHEVMFDPIRPDHRMVGSGMFVINPPWGLDTAAAEVSRLFKGL